MPSNKRYLEAAAVCGPLVLLAAAHVLLTPPPPAPDPSGTNGLIPANLPVAPTAVLTPEQIRAAEWSRTPPAGEMTSPMDHPELVRVTPRPPDPEPRIADPIPIPVQTPARNPLAGLRLTGVMGNAQGGLAMFAGKVYKVGDDIRPGVRLTAIDIEAGTVECTLADGRVEVLKRSP